ncbi:protein shisa-like-1 [Porphyrio hochstetteri]
MEAGAGGAVASASARARAATAQGSAGKMLGGFLLRLLLTTALCTGLLGTAGAQHPHLCEGYAGPDGRYHSGFYCPRLTDPEGHRYCCRPGALKACCPRRALGGGNGSGQAAPGLLRPPPALPLLGLYALLVLLLLAADLLHFCRARRRPGAAPAGRPRPRPRAPRAPPARRCPAPPRPR